MDRMKPTFKLHEWTHPSDGKVYAVYRYDGATRDGGDLWRHIANFDKKQDAEAAMTGPLSPGRVTGTWHYDHLGIEIP